MLQEIKCLHCLGTTTFCDVQNREMSEIRLDNEKACGQRAKTIKEAEPEVESTQAKRVVAGPGCRDGANWTDPCGAPKTKPTQSKGLSRDGLEMTCTERFCLQAA